MIKAVQRLLGPGYAITHLGHAAVLLAHIKFSYQRTSVGTIEIPTISKPQVFEAVFL